MLVQSESEKLKERDMKYSIELQEWKDNLIPKKMVEYFFIVNLLLDIFILNKITT